MLGVARNSDAGPRIAGSIAIPILLFMGGQSGCGLVVDCGGWYRDISIDSKTARVTMIDKLQASRPPDGSGFQDTFRQAGHAIEQLGTLNGGHRRPMLNYLSIDSDYRLIYREKDQELLQGPFGSIYAKSVYFYDARYRGQATGFEVEAYSKNRGVELPVVSGRATGRSW